MVNPWTGHQCFVHHPIVKLVFPNKAEIDVWILNFGKFYAHFNKTKIKNSLITYFDEHSGCLIIIFTACFTPGIFQL